MKFITNVKINQTNREKTRTKTPDSVMIPKTQPEKFLKFRQNLEGLGTKSYIRKSSFNVRKFTNV